MPLHVPYGYRLHGVLVDAISMIVRCIDLNDHTETGLLRSLIERYDDQARKVRMPDTGDKSE